ncbi:MAG: hypothetical protein F4Z31_02745 [Gemmatimonadetes bacterium]|nr:hypothetical protein [Gemmatimonadota bacterium]MYJ10916.1 hypothetical protein [Gemmatimonadota bacterium]
MSDRIPVDPNETIARGVFSSSDYGAESRTVRFGAFLEKGLELSVDRSDDAALDDLVALGDMRAEQRGPHRNFHGWAVLNVAEAKRHGRRGGDGCQVWESGKAENPHHADIELPPLPARKPIDRHLKQHAIRLARRSTWCDRSEHPTDCHEARE